MVEAEMAISATLHLEQLPTTREEPMQERLKIVATRKVFSYEAGAVTNTCGEHGHEFLEYVLEVPNDQGPSVALQIEAFLQGLGYEMPSSATLGKVTEERRNLRDELRTVKANARSTEGTLRAEKNHWVDYVQELETRAEKAGVKLSAPKLRERRPTPLY